MKFWIFLLAICPIALLAQEEVPLNMTTNQSTTPPIAAKKEHQITAHGQTWSDPYFWLREREDEEVLNYLKAENQYTELMTADLKEQKEALYKEILGRIVENDLSVPEQDGPYFYYTKTEEGKSYSIQCRKKGSLDNAEEIYLDENELSEGHKYFSLGDLETSPNHQLIAYSQDTNGSEKYDIFFKDLESGEYFKDEIKEAAGSIVWANDNKTIFYTRLDETMRPYQLWKHELGTDPKDDALVFEEPDPGFYMGVDRSKSGQYFFLYLGNKITTEIHYLSADDPNGDWKLLVKRTAGVEYEVEHTGDDFYLLSNQDALNFKVMKCPVAEADEGNWQEFIAHNDDDYLQGLEAFKDYLIIYGRKNGLKNIWVVDFAKDETYEVDFPEDVYTFWQDENPMFESNHIRFMYSSLITPRTVYDFDLSTKSYETKKEYEVKGGFDKSQYTMERRMVTAPDGAQVPISIAYKKDVKLDGTAPLFLYSYGSYGASTDPYFSTARLSLLERGVIFVMAHIRGGGEKGRHWYEDGKFLNKKNTFTDFIACAEYLIAENFTSSSRLAISGGSAGGLLMGAVTNMRPDLFKFVKANVPFVDVINTMLDDSLPLTVLEYEEWGNPNEKKYFDYMKSYSPYDNVEAQDYPNILITAGLNDPRVQYWEPAKWCAKLRATKTDNNLLLLKTNMGAGHGGNSGRYGWIEDTSFEFAVLFKVLGVEF